MSAWKQPSHVRNVLVTWGGFGLSVIVGLFLSPFVVGTLGTSAFGIWVLIGSLTGTLGIFDMGIRSAVIRFIAREHARGDHSAASRIASTARSMFFAAGGLVMVSALVLAAGMNHWFDIPPEYYRNSMLVLLIAATTLVVSITSGLYFGILSGLQRLDIVAMSDIYFELARAALVLAVLGSGGGLTGLALISLLLGLFRLRYVKRHAERLYPELTITFSRPEIPDVRMILSVSAYSTLIYTSVTAMAQANTLIIGAMLPVSMVAFYSIGTTLPTYAAALNRPIGQTVHPRASRLDALGDLEGLRRVVMDTGRYSSAVLAPVIMTFLVRGHTFIDIWMGPEFRKLSGDVLAVAAIGLVFSAPRHVMQASFVGSGRHKRLGPWYIAEAILVAAISLLAVPRIGILGAAVASLVPGLLMSCVIMPALCAREFGLHWSGMAWNMWVRPAIGIVPFVALSWWLDKHVPVSTYLGFFTQVALCLPVAAAGVWLAALDPPERARAINTVFGR